MKRVALVIVSLCMVLVMVSGCSDGGHDAPAPAIAPAPVESPATVAHPRILEVDLEVDSFRLDSDGELHLTFRAAFPDGSIARTEKEYADKIAEFVEVIEDERPEIKITFGDRFTNILNARFLNGRTFKGPDPVIHAVIEKSRVGGCINREITGLSLSITYKESGQPSQVLHVGNWREGPQTCTGFFESLKGLINKCSCGDPPPTSKQMGPAISTSAIRDGVPSDAAGVLGILAAPAAYEILLRSLVP